MAAPQNTATPKKKAEKVSDKPARKKAEPRVPAQELVLQNRLAALNAQETLTEGEAREKKGLRRQLGEFRFSRVCRDRVVKAKKAIELIGNCSGPGYVYTPAQVEKIRTTIIEIAERTLAKFSAVEEAAEEAFSL